MAKTKFLQFCGAETSTDPAQEARSVAVYKMRLQFAEGELDQLRPGDYMEDRSAARPRFDCFFDVNDLALHRQFVRERQRRRRLRRHWGVRRCIEPRTSRSRISLRFLAQEAHRACTSLPRRSDPRAHP